MSELRKRLANAELDTETETETGNQDSDANLEPDSEDDRSLGQNINLSSTIPTGTDKAPEMLDSALAYLPEKSVADQSALFLSF